MQFFRDVGARSIITNPNIPSWILAAGIATLAIFESTFGLAMGILFIISICSLRLMDFDSLKKQDLAFIALLATYPTVVAISLATQGPFDWREFDTPSRFLLIIPIYIWFRKYLGSLEPIVLGAILGCFATGVYALYQISLFDSEYFRVHGSHNTIAFAQIVFVTTAIAIIPFVTLEPALKRKALTTLILLMGCIGVIASQTRGVFIFTPILLVVYIVYWRILQVSKVEFAVFVLSTGLLFYYLFFVSKITRFNHLIKEFNQIIEYGNFNTSTGERLELWKYALQITQDKLWFGHGKGQFGTALKQIITEEQASSSLLDYHAHNELLYLATETGLIGVFSILALFVGAVIIAYKNRFCRDSLYLLSILSACWLLFGLTSVQLAHHKVILFELLILCIGFSYGMNQKYSRLKPN